MLSEMMRKSLTDLAHNVARHFGRSCEVVIHDLTEENAAEHSIIYIENGDVSGRSVGDGASAIVLEFLSGMHEPEDCVGYFTKTSDGKILKCTSTFMRDSEGKVIAMFSINHDITSLSVAAAAINDLIEPGDSEPRETASITPHVAELLDELLWKSTEMIGKPVSLMNKNDKMRAIRWLNSKGALLITKSGDKIAKYFGISKFTLYSYID